MLRTRLSMICAVVLVLAVAAFLLAGEAAQARGVGGGSFGGARGGGMASGGRSIGGGGGLGTLGGRSVVGPSLGGSTGLRSYGGGLSGLRGYGPPSIGLGRSSGGSMTWPPGGSSLYTPRQDTVYQTAPPVHRPMPVAPSVAGQSSMNIRVLPPWQGRRTVAPSSQAFPLTEGTVSIQPSRGSRFTGPSEKGHLGFLQPSVGHLGVAPFQDFLRQRPAVTPLPGRLRSNLAGSSTSIERFRAREVPQPFRAMVDRFGEPNHRVPFTPRTRPDEWQGGRHDHDGDGHHGDDDDHHGDRDRRHRHHDVVDNDFFFPWYFADPFWFGLWYPGFYPSVYSYWGWTPGWIEPSQAYYSQPTYPAASYDYGDVSAPTYDYALDVPGLAGAMADLEQAWVTGSLDPMSAHLSDQVDVQVHFDGAYAYTTKAKDFTAMTLDTMSTTRTVSVDFDDPIWISPTEVYFTGRQVFTDPDQVQHTMYLSYWLQQYANGWFITGFGSSQQPIVSNYRDFRY